MLLRHYKNAVCSIFLACSDIMGFVFSMYIALAILPYTLPHFEYRVPQNQIEPWIHLHWLLGFCCVAWYCIRLRHYFYRKTFWYELKEILRTLIIFAVIEMAIIAFAKWYFSRYVWLLCWILTCVFVPLTRMLVKYILNLFGLWMRETWIIGSGKNAIDAYNAIKSEGNLGLDVVGFISDKINSSYVDKLNRNVIVTDSGESWLEGKNKSIQFIIALEASEGELRNNWLRMFMIKGYRYVSVIPTLRGMPLDSTDMSFIFSHEVMIFRVQQSLAKLSSRIIKRIFDIIGSSLIIMGLAPVLIYIYLTVRKDGGPAIYGHERVGKNGKLFKCLKFRSMVVNSSQVLDELLKSSKDARLEWEQSFKLKQDPRITRVGAFLRKTSLDELPQLFNVLKGDMSLVGPRPIITDELERYNSDVEYYLLTNPGMTGLWQVSGRSDIDYDTRVYLDAWYVKNWSIWNDIAILFKTISIVFNKTGAY